MPGIRLDNICNFICRNVNLDVRDRELLVLLGPTGAGKSTLLNVVAGLVKYCGSVLFDGTSVDSLPACQRNVGYLFQDLLLFPHLDVFSNIAYSLRVRRKSDEEVNGRLEELLRMMRIEHIANRYPKNLSGGEKQRVALARVLTASPEILLLDEPFSDLDSRTAEYMQMEFCKLQKKLGITTIYVTHDQVEAKEVSDRIAVVHEGVLEQVGTPDEIFFAPQNEKVLDFIGKPNIFECTRCHVVCDGLMKVECGDISMIVPYQDGRIKKIAVFPKHVCVSKEGSPHMNVNRFTGLITEISHIGSITRIEVKVASTCFLAELPSEIFRNLDITVGEEVFLTVPINRIMIC